MLKMIPNRSSLWSHQSAELPFRCLTKNVLRQISTNWVTVTLSYRVIGRRLAMGSSWWSSGWEADRFLLFRGRFGMKTALLGETPAEEIKCLDENYEEVVAVV